MSETKEIFMASYKSVGGRGPLEIDSINPHALISFRAIVAGLLVAMFTFIGLVGLGLAFGGMRMDQETTAQSAGIFSGIWFIISVLLALFVGSYFAARISKFRTGRVGSLQGLVIAALFIGFFMYQTLVMIGSAGLAIGSLIGRSGSMIAGGIERASESPQIYQAVSNLTEDALGDLNLRSPPNEVAQGVAARLIRGDSESAKNYLSRQAGITPTEADAKIAQMKGQVDQYVANAKEATATAIKSAGWTLFLLVALGSLAAIGGGALGSVINFRKPLVRESTDYSYPRGGQTV
jgi:hypothetical protein